MFRRPNTAKDGSAFSDWAKQYVWQMARLCPGRDPTYWRQDVCGDPIYWFHYGNTSHSTGWEIDHIYPIALGGTDDFSNLQALAWENNRSKSDKIVGNYCVIRPIKR